MLPSSCIAVPGVHGYGYDAFAPEPVFPPRARVESFPLELGKWRCPGAEEMEPTAFRRLGVTDYLLCEYSDDSRTVGVYFGYHAAQIRESGGGSSGETNIHPPAHCLPGSGWDIIAHEKVVLDLPGLPQRPAAVNRLVIARGNLRQLVYYWYQERGRVTADDWKKIVFTSLDRARYNRTDGALVRYTTFIPQNGEAAAEAALLDLAARTVPLLPPYIP